MAVRATLMAMGTPISISNISNAKIDSVSIGAWAARA
jgi:hypothetical protein